MLKTLERAVNESVVVLRGSKVSEPRFTRQLLSDFEHARDGTFGTPRYDVTHQPELPLLDSRGVVVGYRRLDFRLLFRPQVGRTGDYLCIEFKYLNATDRSSDWRYVYEGVDRIVAGEYARRHPWAIMVGLERVGPILAAIRNVDERLIGKYGPEHGFKAQTVVRLNNVRESDHFQGGTTHEITILHAFYLIGD